MTGFSAYFLLPISALIGAAAAVSGHYYMQFRVAPRRRDADYLKTRLYELFEAAAEYWTLNPENESDRLKLEARINAGNMVVSLECEEMKRHSKRLEDWFISTEKDLLDLVDAVAGGGFQQRQWDPDPKRIPLAEKSIRNIVSSLNRAC